MELSELIIERDSGLKRSLDIILSLGLLIFAIIPMGIVALAVIFTSPGPVIFWSERVGQFNTIFRMPKFRTMILSAPLVATDRINKPQAYLTKIGAILRKTSLDELPQLWTILNGKMTLVGPRPALFNQIDLIELRTEAGVHVLKPGLVGWAQINGRDNLTTVEKVYFDKEYLEKMSLKFDLYILIRAFILVIKGVNVSH